MSEAEHKGFFYPNKMGRIILLGMEEVVGRNGLNAVLNMAGLSELVTSLPPNNLEPGFEFEQLSKIQASLEKMYGPRGGHGVALRTGRACFKYGLREFGSSMGLTNTAFQLLPLQEKILLGSSLFADVFNNYTDQRVHIEDAGGQILWHIDRCPVCWGRQATDPVCHLAVGILQEALYWVSGGRYFYVEETSCIARGDQTCIIAIEKQPLE
jgi:predicted hydrocarbon binding protein